MVSAWRFQSASGKNCTADPHDTAKAPSSMRTSGGVALESRASHEAEPSAERVSPLLHHSFWPKPRTPAVTAIANEFMALAQAALLGYLAGIALCPAAAGNVIHRSVKMPSARQGWSAM